jgi:hypothetical protein
VIARDVYHCHYDDLPSAKKAKVVELLALRLVEIEYEKEALERIKAESGR